MSKFPIIIALVYISYAAAQIPCRFCPFPASAEQRNCIQDEAGRRCRILSFCQIEEENCRLRRAGRAGVIVTHMSTCRNVGPSGAPAPCGPFNCRERVCDQDNEQTNCYEARNGCKLSTLCRVYRENRCVRPRRDLLRRVNARRCRGMRAREDLQACTN